jgi:hypothetical protein
MPFSTAIFCHFLGTLKTSSCSFDMSALIFGADPSHSQVLQYILTNKGLDVGTVSFFFIYLRFFYSTMNWLITS